MSRTIAPLFLCSLLVSAGLGAQSSDPAALLDSMAKDYYQGVAQAAFGAFTYEYSGLPTPFARWLEERLSAAAAKTARVKIINRSAALAMDPAFRKEYESFFADASVGSLLAGSYFLEKSYVRVHLELTDLSTRLLIGSGDLIVPLDAVPAYASVKPEEKALAQAKELASLGVSAPAGLSVSLATDRGASAGYREGETLSVMLKVNKDAYVRLYHVDSSGKTQLIWPNQFGGGSGLVHAGAVVILPGPDDPFTFTMEPPYGMEFLKAVASTVPFSDSQASFTDLPGKASAPMTRGLRVAAAAKPEAAEAMAVYYIGPK